MIGPASSGRPRTDSRMNIFFMTFTFRLPDEIKNRRALEGSAVGRDVYGDSDPPGRLRPVKQDVARHGRSRRNVSVVHGTRLRRYRAAAGYDNDGADRIDACRGGGRSTRVAQGNRHDAAGCLV